MLADIEGHKPDLVGISVPSMAQLTPALTIAALIKQHGLACHVALGGPHITIAVLAGPRGRCRDTVTR